MTNASTSTVACSGCAGTGTVLQQSDERREPALTSVSNNSGTSCSDDDATSMGFSMGTVGEVSLAPSGEIFYIQDPTAPPLSRGTSGISWATNLRRAGSGHFPSVSEHGHGNPWLPETTPSPVAGTDARLYVSQPCGAEPQGKDLDSTCRKAPVIKLHRPIMSRHNRDIFRVQATLAPRDAGVDGVGGCCGACRAPSSLPWCAHLFGCCSYPEELEEARRESSYLVIRDNAVEFNNPRVVLGARPTGYKRSPQTKNSNRGGGGGQPGMRSKEGTYTGACGCNFHVRDDARVLYFDDPVLHDISAITKPLCGTLWQLLCGRRGQSVRLQSRFCWGRCLRSRGPCVMPCVSPCCMCLCAPCALQYEMPAKDAVDAAAKITRARDAALSKMRLDYAARAAVRHERR